MAIKEIVLLIFIIVCFMEAVYASGYGGGGGHSYMVPGGSRGRKWKIRAKGKGMQNMMHMPSYKKEEKKEHEVVYYPVPVYSKSKKYYDDKEDEYESKQDIKIIPMYGYGKGGDGYGKGGDEYGGYGGYQHYGKSSNNYY